MAGRKFSLFNNQYINPKTMKSLSGVLQGGVGLGMMYNSAMEAIPGVAGAPVEQRTGVFNAPVYNLGALQTNLDQINSHDPNTPGMAIGGAMQGAQAGSAILPGVGTAVGAGIGAIAGLFTGQSAEEEKRKRRAEATNQLRSAQDTFNYQNEESNRNRLAYESYMKLIS